MYLYSTFRILTYKIRMRDILLLNISQCHFPFVFIGYFYAKNDILLFYPNYNNSSIITHLTQPQLVTCWKSFTSDILYSHDFFVTLRLTQIIMEI